MWIANHLFLKYKNLLKNGFYKAYFDANKRDYIVIGIGIASKIVKEVAALFMRVGTDIHF